MNKHFVIAAFLSISTFIAHSQGVAINEDGSQPNESALLDININNAGPKRGILIPRMTTNERNLIKQVNGLLVYVTDDNSFYYSDGKNWKHLGNNPDAVVAVAANKITNPNGETKIEIQGSAAGDQMSFTVKGKEIWRHDGKTLNTKTYLPDGTESYNILIGDKAGQSLATGIGNTMVGVETGVFTTSGNYNTFIGKLSGYANSQGSGNTFLGYAAGQQNTSGLLNVFVGHGAGRNNKTGRSNVFIGNYCANDNVNGDQNVFIGHDTGSKNTDGSSNIFIGQYSGNTNTSGSNNVFLGQTTGFNNTTGQFNTYIGQAAGEKSTGASNVFIGFRAGRYEAGSNKLYIANSESATPLLQGDFQDAVLNVNGRLNVRDVLNLPAKNTAPNNPKIGDLYMDNSDPNNIKMRVYTKLNGKEQWRDLY
jgi:hypothetical protein